MRRRLNQLSSLLLMLTITLLFPLTIRATTPPPRCLFAKSTCQTEADAAWNVCRTDGGLYAICWLVYNDTYYYCMSNMNCS